MYQNISWSDFVCGIIKHGINHTARTKNKCAVLRFMKVLNIIWYYHKWLWNWYHCLFYFFFQSYYTPCIKMACQSIWQLILKQWANFDNWYFAESVGQLRSWELVLCIEVWTISCNGVSNYSSPVTKIRACISDYIPNFYVNVITYPRPKLSAG